MDARVSIAKFSQLLVASSQLSISEILILGPWTPEALRHFLLVSNYCLPVDPRGSQ
jgi:hypothetical protein